MHNLYVKNGGSWREIWNIDQKDSNGITRKVQKGWIKENGEWRLFFEYRKYYDIFINEPISYFDLQSTLKSKYNWKGQPFDLTITIGNDGIIGSQRTDTPALLIPNAFDSSSTISIINNGKIVGKGGYPGAGGSRVNGINPGSSGNAGGDAINVQFPVSITNNGIIGGGGGGGGGGFGNWDTNGGYGGIGAGYINQSISYSQYKSYDRTAYIAGWPAGGCGPAIGFGYLGDGSWINSTVDVPAQWWYNGIHVQTGGYMGSADPTGGTDSQGWAIRRIVAYENGNVVYDSYQSWWAGTSAKWPSGWTNLGKYDEQYIYGDEFAGGGDYWAVYSYRKSISVLTGVTYFQNGIIPITTKTHIYNSASPTENLVFCGKNVTSSQLAEMGLNIPESRIARVNPGETIYWSTWGAVDHHLDIGYWVWNAGSTPSAAIYSYLVRTTFGDGGRQSFSYSSSIQTPNVYGDNQVLVFGIGDRQSSCPCGMHSVYFSASSSSSSSYSQSSNVLSGTVGTGKHPGGNGGSLGSAGAEGSYYGSGVHAYGGSAGRAVVGNNKITWVKQGDVRGTVV